MEGKIAVLGNTDFVMPFSALGLDTFSVDSADEITENAKKIIEAKYPFIVVAENIAPKAQESFSAQMDIVLPCIIVVPFTTASEGFATKSLGRLLKIATGINILQNN